jgi:hypothetical protein
MRMLNPSLAVASLLSFLTAASCTLITDVDRTKIPADAGPSAGTGGVAGETGSGGVGNEGGTSPEAGTGGGGTNGGTGGTGGTNGGTGGTSAGGGGDDGGTGGSSTPTEACDEASGRITIGVGTLLTSGWTFTLGDGLHDKVAFTFDWDDDSSDEPGDNIIHFSGAPSTAELAVKIADAINAAADLDIKATTTATTGGGGGGGGGEGGAGGEAGSGVGGQAGAVEPPTPMNETVELVNEWAGERGNVKITDTVGNPNFKVSGMSGGKAVICGDAASCSSDDECDSARSCNSDHICE